MWGIPHSARRLILHAFRTRHSFHRTSSAEVATHAAAVPQSVRSPHTARRLRRWRRRPAAPSSHTSSGLGDAGHRQRQQQQGGASLYVPAQQANCKCMPHLPILGIWANKWHSNDGIRACVIIFCVRHDGQLLAVACAHTRTLTNKAAALAFKRNIR